MCDRYRTMQNRDGLFEEMYGCIRENWRSSRELNRLPSPKNWVLRVAPNFKFDPTKRVEKQLQKEIAIALQSEGWGNDMPTASGLVNNRSRQMNVDIAHKLIDGIELYELKVASDTPYHAALQILRYGAIYSLYRLEPELATQFRENKVILAKHVALKVLAPHGYYCTNKSNFDLSLLEVQIDRQVRHFAEHMLHETEMSFEFQAFPDGFIYKPGMGREAICDAVRRRCSPFDL